MATRKADPKGKKTNGAANHSDDGLQVQNILLTDIEADYSWNSRSGKLDVDSGDEEGNAFNDLVSSLRSNGQDEPVDVRPKKSGKGFLLTTGFRRYTALTKIAKEDGTEKTATIKAFVRHDNETQARARNLRENTARDNLKGPDLAFGIHDYKLKQLQSGGSPSQAGIAAELGMNQAYVGRLWNIMAKGKPSVTKMWRESPVKVSVLEMLQVVEHSEEKRQIEAFKEIVAGKENKAAGARGPDAWVDTAVSKAADLGTMFGRLAKADLLDCDGLDFEDESHMALVMKIPAKATAAQKKKIGRAAAVAFDKALKAKDEPAESAGAEAN